MINTDSLNFLPSFNGKFIDGSTTTSLLLSSNSDLIKNNNNLIDVPCTSTSSSSSNSLLDKIKIEKFVVENENNNNFNLFNNENDFLREQSKLEMKRPSATIGIATVHRNGLIQSPMGLNNNHNNSSLIRQPPNKMAKLESDDGNK
uniref:Uncharacterized protein n=1 Tax=Meloidogyne floridensis TaxID=298350 RepID=A0A915NJW3_9BILA